MISIIDLSEHKNNIITQSNKLTEARYNLTVGEQRLVLTILSLISPSDDELKTYKINILDFKKILNLNTNSIYDKVRTSLEKLSKRSLSIPTEDGGYLIANWFSSARYIPKEQTVVIRIDEDLKPYLLRLKEQFTKYNLFTLAKFQSSYTIRIYMLLKQYINIGYREFSLEEFRKLLDITDNFYKEYKDLRKRIIDQTKKEFDNSTDCDLTFELETRRTGRKITNLKFIIIKKKNIQEILDLPSNFEEGFNNLIDNNSDVLDELLDFGISGTVASKWINEYDIEYLKSKLTYVKKQKKLGIIQKNVTGYLHNAITDDWKDEQEIKLEDKQNKILKDKQNFKIKFMKKWELNIISYYNKLELKKKESSLSSEEKKSISEQAHNSIKYASVNKEIYDMSLTGKYEEILIENYVIPPTKEKIIELAFNAVIPSVYDFSDILSWQKLEYEKYIEEFNKKFVHPDDL